MDAWNAWKIQGISGTKDEGRADEQMGGDAPCASPRVLLRCVSYYDEVGEVRRVGSRSWSMALSQVEWHDWTGLTRVPGRARKVPVAFLSIKTHDWSYLVAALPSQPHNLEAGPRCY